MVRSLLGVAFVFMFGVYGLTHAGFLEKPLEKEQKIGTPENIDVTDSAAPYAKMQLHDSFTERVYYKNHNK